MVLKEEKYLLRKTEDVEVSSGWRRDSAERDWRPLVWVGMCGKDSNVSSWKGEESSSVWSVVSLAALCLWKGFLFGDPGRNSDTSSHLYQMPKVSHCAAEVKVTYTGHYVNIFGNEGKKMIETLF